jgi:hypothetical protein
MHKILGLLVLLLLQTQSAWGQTQTTIDFDSLTTTCSLQTSYPLTTEFTSVGVTFAGDYAPLDHCSPFGVTGYSAPNYVV